MINYGFVIPGTLQYKNHLSEMLASVFEVMKKFIVKETKFT